MYPNPPHRLVLAAITLSALATLPAVGQAVPVDANLLPNDLSGGDFFGASVAISGSTALVGASGDDDNGDGSGSAYLFDTSTGQQLFKLLPSDGTEGDFFGASVAISGTTALVGAFEDDDNGDGSGSAYLFDTTTGQQLFKLLPSDGTALDNFGTSVAISGTTAVIGADGDDDNGFNSGSVYLFDTTTGQQIAKLLPNDGAEDDSFGSSIAIDGTTIVVGAHLNDDNGNNSGSAYLFDTITGQQIAKLLPNDGGVNSRFGNSVAISGTTALIGNSSGDNNGMRSGAAYLFDTSTGQQIAKILPSDAELSDRFGTSVAISGTLAMIGASRDDDNGPNSGSAYLFDTSTGQQIAKFLARDGLRNDEFGECVAISGTSVLVGAVTQINENGFLAGSAYLFATFCLADLNGDLLVNFFDVSQFLSYYFSNNPIADFNGDGLFNFVDVSEFLAAFGEGCP